MRFSTSFPVTAASLVLSVVLLSASSSSIVNAAEEQQQQPAVVLVGEDNVQRCLSEGEFDPETDYFPSKFSPIDYKPAGAKLDPVGDDFIEFAQDVTTDLFSISYHNHYKIVTNDFVNKTYLLYLCGTEPPQAELDGRHHLVLPIPHAGGVAVTETPQIPYLELLGLRNQIIGYIGDPQWVSSPCMRYMMDVDKSIEIVFDPDDPYNSTIIQNLTADFLQRHPDALIFGGPYGDMDGDRVVICAETQERTTVATFDWIGYFAAFFNLEALSNQIAAETKARYECASSNAATLSADRPPEERPLVLWANYFDGYNWSIAECPTWDATYYCEYAMHCGAKIVSRPEGYGWNNPDFGGRYWYVNDDQLLELGKNADFFIYPSTTWDEVYAEKKSVLDQIKAVQNKQVYDNQGPGPNAWHEQRLAEYDVVALDFCDIVGNAVPTSDLGALHKRRWLRNIFTEPIGSLGECNAPTEIDEPYVAQGAQCTPLSEEQAGGQEGTGNSSSSKGSMVRISSAVMATVALAFVFLH